MVDDIITAICSFFASLPFEAQVALIAVVVLIFLGIEKKAQDEREAREAERRFKEAQAKRKNRPQNHSKHVNGGYHGKPRE
jgi:hypothetical protein